MSQLRTPEGEKSREQEQISPKTGLELIRMAVGEHPVQWIEMRLAYHVADLRLTMVGENGIRGVFKKDSFSSFFYKPSEQSLEEIGAVKTEAHHGIHWDPHYPINVARNLKEVKGEGVIFLVFVKSEDPLIGDEWELYEVPVKNLEGLIAKADKQGGKYWLSAGLVTLEFSARKGGFVNEGYTAPFGKIKIGEAVPQIENALEESRRLEGFLVANRNLFR